MGCSGSEFCVRGFDSDSNLVDRLVYTVSAGSSSSSASLVGASLRSMSFSTNLLLRRCISRRSCRCFSIIIFLGSSHSTVGEICCCSCGSVCAGVSGRFRGGGEGGSFWAWDVEGWSCVWGHSLASCVGGIMNKYDKEY